MGMPPPRTKFSRSLPAGEQRPTGPGSSTEKHPGVHEGAQPVAEDTSSTRTGAGNREDLSRKDYNDPLFQLMVEAGIASDKKGAVSLLDVCSMLKKRTIKYK